MCATEVDDGLAVEFSYCGIDGMWDWCLWFGLDAKIADCTVRQHLGQWIYEQGFAVSNVGMVTLMRSEYELGLACSALFKFFLEISLGTYALVETMLWR